MTTIDFNQLMNEAGDSFQPIPDGPYHVEVAKSEATTTSTNKPMIRVQLRIIGGPHAGRIVFDQFVLTAGNPNALSFFFEHMAAFGLDRSFFAQNPPMEMVAATLMNRQALIAVGTRTEGQYAGRNEVKKYSPPPMGQVGGAPGGGQVIAFPQAPTAPPVAPPAPVAPAAPVMPVAPPPAPQPAPAAPVAPPAPAPIPPLPPGVAPPQPVYQQPAPQPVTPAPAGVPYYNSADEEPY